MKLTAEEKKYLNFICRYLGSYGLNKATVSFVFEENFNISAYDLDEWVYFSEGNDIEIPEDLKNIYQRILSYIEGLRRFKKANPREYNKEIEILISCREKTITAFYHYSKYVISETKKAVYKPDRIFDYLEKLNPKEKIWELKYQGSNGDGFLRNKFENDINVPTYILEWCDAVLEDFVGDWDKYDGGYGKFEFDSMKKKISLVHHDMEEVYREDTIIEEEF